MTVTTITHMPNTQKHSGVSGIPTLLLVVHSGECPLRGGYAQSLTNWANVPEAQGGPQASWHWFADPIAIVSMVDPMLAAWHASEANPMSEGFEQAGYARFNRAEWLTDDGRKSIDNLAWLLVQRMRANDIPHRWLTTDEVEAVTKRGNRSIKGLCLHRQIDPETRTDPGDNYPFDYLDERIRVHLGTATPEEDTLSADMPMISKDGKNVTLEIQLQAIDRKTEAVAEAVKGLPKFDQQVRERLALDVEAQARQEAQIAALTDAVKALATTQDSTAILAAIEAGMDKFRDSYQVTLQRVQEADK